jgi:hypothetical protein
MLIRILAILFCFCSFSLIAQTTINDTMIVATVNSFPISLKEYQFCEKKCKASIIQDFQTTYKLKYDENFWNLSSIKPTPTEALKKKAFVSVVELKIQQELARELGLIQDFSYKTFLTNLQAENKRRFDALQNKQVVFGPEQYSEENYFDYLFTNLVIQIKKKLSENTLGISDNQLRQIYEKRKNKLYKLDDFVQIQRVTLETNAKNNIDLSKLTNKIMFNMINKDLDIVKLNDLFSCLCKITADTLTFDPSKYTIMEGETQAEIKRIVNNFKPKQKVYLKQDSRKIEIYKILQRKPLGFRSFESIKNGLKSIEINKLYSEYITKRLSEAIIVQY